MVPSSDAHRNPNDEMYEEDELGSKNSSSEQVDDDNRYDDRSSSSEGDELGDVGEDDGGGGALGGDGEPEHTGAAAEVEDPAAEVGRELGQQKLGELLGFRTGDQCVWRDTQSKAPEIFFSSDIGYWHAF